MLYIVIMEAYDKMEDESSRLKKGIWLRRIALASCLAAALPLAGWGIYRAVKSSEDYWQYTAMTIEGAAARSQDASAAEENPEYHKVEVSTSNGEKECVPYNFINIFSKSYDATANRKCDDSDLGKRLDETLEQRGWTKMEMACISHIMRDQKGCLSSGSKIIKKGVEDEVARAYIKDKLYELEEFASENGYDDYADAFTMLIREELSRKDGLGKYKKNFEVGADSTQTLPEFIMNDFSGDCEDFAVGMQTAYEAAVDISGELASSDEDGIWGEVNSSLLNKPIYVIWAHSKKNRLIHIMNMQFDLEKKSMKPIEPQLHSGEDIFYLEDGELYVDDCDEQEYKVISIFDSKDNIFLEASD